MSRFNGKRGRFSRFSASASSGPSVIVTGGTLFSDENYYYRVFDSSGTLSVSGGDLEVAALVVAGGGAGGDRYFYWSGRGGGAGGVLGSVMTVGDGESLNILIGAGSAPWKYPPGTGSNSTITKNGSLLANAIGGGDGGTPWGEPGANGGSGGGGGGLGTPGQGYNGGAGNGGGGGAYGLGQDGDNDGSNGGPGTSAFSSFGMATGTGELVGGTYYYGGGGASVGWDYPVQGRGGDGGGSGNQRPGGGGNYPPGIPGLINTGGGGNSRGAGGSGIVIIRYLKPGAEFVPYPATLVSSTQVPGAWVRDFGCSNPNWWAWYGAPWFAEHPDQMLDPAGCINGGINVYMIAYQNEYSCPLGGTSDGNGMCV